MATLQEAVDMARKFLDLKDFIIFVNGIEVYVSEVFEYFRLDSKVEVIKPIIRKKKKKGFKFVGYNIVLKEGEDKGTVFNPYTKEDECAKDPF